MHFSKTYIQLLEDLPPELQVNVIQYRQLKKIIKQTVNELSSLGLRPCLLHKLFQHPCDTVASTSLDDGHRPGDLGVSLSPSADGRVTCFDTSERRFPKIVYEFNEEDSRVEAQLHIPAESIEELSDMFCHGTNEQDVEEQSEADTSVQDNDEMVDPNNHVIVELENLCVLPDQSLSQKAAGSHERPGVQTNDDGLLDVEATPVRSRICETRVQETVITLVSDSAFFDLLYTTLEHMSAQLKSVEGDFMETLKVLSRTIGDTARPVSSSHSAFGRRRFHALSPLKDHAGAIHVRRSDLSNSDLYSWREIFQLYMEAEVFESVREWDRGERSVEDCERRLQLFVDRVTRRGLTAQDKLKSKQGCHALRRFLQLNALILNIKKFQSANSEATRKILKKHAKRTALPAPSDLSSHLLPRFALIRRGGIGGGGGGGGRVQWSSSSSLPRVLVQAIGETLLPIIPHLDDYSCFICMNIAFKPIRLDCGHLFCVRCLVKMQKRGQDDCPMCRAPSVVVANRSNVDWALMNFMQDWFPLEAKEKLKANEEEANAEELARLGLDSDTSCVVA